MYQLTPGGLHPLGFFFVRIKSLRKKGRPILWPARMFRLRDAH